MTTGDGHVSCGCQHGNNEKNLADNTHTIEVIAAMCFNLEHWSGPVKIRASACKTALIAGEPAVIKGFMTGIHNIELRCSLQKLTYQNVSLSYDGSNYLTVLNIQGGKGPAEIDFIGDHTELMASLSLDNSAHH